MFFFVLLNFCLFLEVIKRVKLSSTLGNGIVIRFVTTVLKHLYMLTS